MKEKGNRKSIFLLAFLCVAVAGFIAACDGGVEEEDTTEYCDGSDNNSNDSKDEDCNSCASMKSIGSAANITNGNLFHDQPLFEGLTLYYNSLNSYDGPLGNKWSHSHDISVTAAGDGSVLFKDGSGRSNLYTPSGDAYTAQPGNYSVLSKSGGLFSITTKNGSVMSFNGNGKISAITDRNGNSTAFAYSSEHLLSVTDPEGRVTSFTVGGSGRINAIIDPSGNTYSFNYDSSGNLIGATYPQPDGSLSSWSYTYNNNSYLHTKTDVNGYTVTYGYDGEWRVSSSETSEGEIHQIIYNPGNEETEITAPDGGVWSYVYDKRLGVPEQKTDPEGGVTTYSYDENENLTSTTDPEGNVTAYAYDEDGNMASETDAEGNTISYTYSDYGKVSSVTDSEGNSTFYNYDDSGNLKSTTDPAGATISYEYDARGNVTKITDATGGTTAFTYDGQNNLISITEPSGATKTFTYDAKGNMISQTDADGSTTIFEYNSLGQLIKVTDPFGAETTYTYDKKGNRISGIDANGNTTYYEYNHKDQLIKVTDALGNITQYSYGDLGCSACGGSSNAGKLSAITDAGGNKTLYDYDNLGRLTTETDPFGNSITYEYDSRGNMIAKTDAEGNRVSYVYNKLGRLLNKTFPDGSTETLTYDSRGNIITAANKHIGYTLTYDVSSRVTSVTDSERRTISYEYDLSGNRTTLVAPDGKVTGYAYDKSNRLKEITSGETFIFSYDEAGRKSSLTYPNGVIATYDYDENGRLVDLLHRASGGSIVARNTYTHDNIGNRLTNTSQARKAEYRYDDIYRLSEANYATPGWSTTESHENGSGDSGGITNAIEQQTEIYTYDPAGNRLTSEHSKIYTYNEGNQLATFNGTTYNYDKNGNLVSKTSSSETIGYTYDYENRLIKAVKTAGGKTTTATFKYDPFGRRIKKKVTINGSATTTRYFYDKEDILFEYDVNGNMGNRYVHGAGIDEPLSLTNVSGSYYYHADSLGSIVALTDKNQNIVQTYDYYYFGKLKDEKSRIKQPYRFTGREWDKEIKLYYYRARYYDADVGRFTQFDPILHPKSNQLTSGNVCGTSIKIKTPFEKIIENPLNLNPFVYVQNNPINNIDPSGETCYTAKQIDTLGEDVKSKIPDSLLEAIQKPCWKWGCFDCCAGVEIELSWTVQVYGLCTECSW